MSSNRVQILYNILCEPNFLLLLCGSASLCTATAAAWRVMDSGSGNTKIVGGLDTTINSVPYMVNLRLKGRFICGGSLITKTCVLTAAHCVHGIQPTDLTVHAGSTLLSDPGEVRAVQQFFTSPFYVPRTLDMDVAILKLTKSYGGDGGRGRDDIRDSIKTIPLCNMKPANDGLAKISGWGITDESNHVPPDRVRTANVHVISLQNCSAAYAGSGVSLTSTMFCAAEIGVKDSCSGDSGGPLVYNGRVCGIVSWGIGCARMNYPGVYTDISSRRVSAFVRQIMARNC